MVSATRNVFGWHRGGTATELIDVQREPPLNRELAARTSAGPEGRSAGATALRTVGYVLASTVCYYVATQIAWALTFPDSKVSLFFPRTRSWFASCCSSPLGTGGPTYSLPSALIFWQPNRSTGRRCTH